MEIIPQAIEDARRNARLNQIGKRGVFRGGKRRKCCRNSMKRRKPKAGSPCADVIVVDRPGRACDAKLLDTIPQNGAAEGGVCELRFGNPARDLKILCAGGYRLERVRAVDNFCQTVHTECVVRPLSGGDLMGSGGCQIVRERTGKFEI